MKLTLGKMISALTSGSLARLARLDLPVKTSYEHNKTAKAAFAESTVYDERRMVLLTKYGTPIEGTPNFTIHDVPAYNGDLEVLHSIEVDLPGEPIKLSEVLAAKEGRLVPDDFNRLLDTFIIKDVP